MRGRRREKEGVAGKEGGRKERRGGEREGRERLREEMEPENRTKRDGEPVHLNCMCIRAHTTCMCLLMVFLLCLSPPLW